MATMFHRPEDHSVAIAEQAATCELVRPEQKTTMNLPRKHIAEGIAGAIMVGVGGVRGALANGDRWVLGEPYLFVAGHALPNPSEEDVWLALASTNDQPMRIQVAQTPATDSGGIALTSKHGRCYEVVSDRRADAGKVERMFVALATNRTPVRARPVETILPARRCCAPGCGDKIKSGDTYEITWSDDTVSYLEGGCAEWFVNGHPDHGCGNGHVNGLPS